MLPSASSVAAEPDGPALQIFDVVLPVDLLDGQIVPFQDDLEQQVGASLVLKNLAHEVVIQQPEATDDLQILFVLPDKFLRKAFYYRCVHSHSSCVLILYHTFSVLKRVVLPKNLNQLHPFA